jgi:competence protein ComEA
MEAEIKMSGTDGIAKAVVIGLAALLAVALFAIVLQRRNDHQPLEINLASLTPTPGGPIQVYVTGAVTKPGVYELHDGDRVVDALYAAGGQAAEANLEAVNLAVRLHDEDQIVIPRQGEPVAATGSTSNVAGASNAGLASPVNINTATASELDALPGIGAVYSNRIVQSRSTDGPFATPDDLLARKLLPRATFENILALITVGP